MNIPKRRVTNSTPQAETNVERGKKKTIKQYNRAQKKLEWRDTSTEPPRLHQYLYRREERKEGRKIERLPLKAKIEAETVDQEDEIVSETVEQNLKP